MYKCSPDFYTGCDSSIYIRNSKTYWHCHNASNNGGREGGALGTVEISDDADMKYMFVANPQDSVGFITHSSNNISNLIIHNAHKVGGLVFWAIVHLNVFDSLILNVKSKPLIQDLKKLSLYGTFVQQDSGNIGTNFTTNFEQCNLFNYKHNLHNQIEFPSCETEYPYPVAAMAVDVIFMMYI